MWVQALSKRVSSRSVSAKLFVAAKAVALAGLLFVAACAENKPPAPEVKAAAPGGVEPGSPQDFLLNVGDRVFFTENSTELSSTSIASLDKQAAWLSRFVNYNITVEGHSDEKGDVRKNRRLSEQRAKAVQNYLVSKGIEPGRIHVVFYGRDNRVAKCDDVSCRSQNRRVVTVLQPAAEPAFRTRGHAPQQSQAPRMPVYASPPQ
jgi:peptidoglycan-associated lipoprotein